jgi:hypothetical protein
VHINKYILPKIVKPFKGMKMAQLDLDEKSLKKNSLLIPAAVILGTLLAITAYTYLPPTTALIGIFVGTIVVALITYAVLKKKYHQ